MNDILRTARSGAEMERAVPGARIALYGDVCRLVKKHGIRRVMKHLIQSGPNWILLLQSPFDSNMGHWMGLKIFPEAKRIYFFSSYGGKPDVEKLVWIPPEYLEMSGQDINALNNGLRDLRNRYGWEVHYNDHPYQFEGDGTATCGIWTAGFLNSDMNPDEFYLYNLFHHLGAEDYYRAFFTD